MVQTYSWFKYSKKIRCAAIDLPDTRVIAKGIYITLSSAFLKISYKILTSLYSAIRWANTGIGTNWQQMTYLTRWRNASLLPSRMLNCAKWYFFGETLQKRKGNNVRSFVFPFYRLHDYPEKSPAAAIIGPTHCHVFHR